MKEKMAGKETKKRLFSGTLALTMILSMMQITSIPVMAATYTNGGLYEGGSGDSGEPAATKTVTITMDDVRAAAENSITKDGVTLTADTIDAVYCDIMMGGTFTTSSGKITQIEIQGIICTGMGDGWMAYVGAGPSVTKWTGSASSSVSFDGDIMSMGGHENYTIVITIETPTGVSTHTHGSWDYTADGATLTAECKADGDCDLTDGKVSLTLTSDNSQVTITGTEAWAQEFGTENVPVVYYEGTGGTTYAKKDEVPTAPGVYKATITVGTGDSAVTAETTYTVYSNAYTLTVPADLTITQPGWNALDSVKVSGNISPDKQIKVTAASANEFKLKSGENTVSYTLKKSEADTEELGTVTFSSAAVNAENGASQTVGINVEDYSDKPEGNYEDTITWTATMENVSSQS